jgi:hypothetical protein
MTNGAGITAIAHVADAPPDGLDYNGPGGRVLPPHIAHREPEAKTQLWSLMEEGERQLAAKGSWRSSSVPEVRRP